MRQLVLRALLVPLVPAQQLGQREQHQRLERLLPVPRLRQEPVQQGLRVQALQRLERPLALRVRQELLPELQRQVRPPVGQPTAPGHRHQQLVLVA